MDTMDMMDRLRIGAGIACLLWVQPMVEVAAAEPPPLPSAEARFMESLAGTTPVVPVGPRIRFAEPVHDFGTVNAGEVLKYTFTFTNAGDLPLELTNVSPSCGCTAAGAWTKQVPPGQTGIIPLQLNTANFSGPVSKQIAVYSNDTNQPVFSLQLKGTVFQPVEVLPRYAMLNVTVDAPEKETTVRILNHLPQPLELQPPVCDNRAFAVQLRTNTPGQAYELVVKTVPPFNAGNINGNISLKTSSTNVPVISVSVWANVQLPVLATPSEIRLAALPLPQAQVQTVYVRNNGTNSLTISDPVVSVPGVGVQVKEIQPGRFFHLLLSFPAGFDLPADQKVELTFKSSHPQYSVLRVPITSMQAKAALRRVGSTPAGTAATTPASH